MNFRDTIGHVIEAAATGAVGTAKSLMAYVKQLVTSINDIHDTDLPAISSKIDAGFALTGDAVVANVLDGKFFYKDNYQTKLEGTMPNNAGDVASVSAHMDAGTVLHVVPAEGYTDGSDDATTIDLTTVDADLVTGNIKSGVTILGVAGSSTVKDVSDWTDAVEGDVASGKKFYKADGSQATGTHV
jgi:hypothetical protein